MRNANLNKTIILLIISSGILVSIFQYMDNRSLWLDEAYLSLNIIKKSHAELLKPLEFKQVAPVLFLQVEKIFSRLIPNSEFGLRLFPLLSFWLALFFFYRIIKAIQPNDHTKIFSLSLFVFNPTMIYYSSEVKQYMTDVLTLTVVYFFLVARFKKDQTRLYFLGIIGVVIIFLSNVAPIVLFTAGLYLFFGIYHNRKESFLPLIYISMFWALSFFLYYLMFAHNHPARTDMIIEWENYRAFMPGNPFTFEFYQFFFRKGFMIYVSLFQFGTVIGIALSALTLVGFIGLVRHKRMDILILFLTPVILHLVLSSLRLYPFETRLILYTYPCIVMICCCGLKYVTDSFGSPFKIRNLGMAAIVIPFVLAAHVYKIGFPVKRCEIKECIKFIEQNINEKDKLYINYFARIPFRYYEEVSFMQMANVNVIIGKKNDVVWKKNRYVADTIGFSNELNFLTGRVWFLFTSIGDENEKMRFLIDYFSTRGKKIILEFHSKGSDVYLYEVGNRLD